MSKREDQGEQSQCFRSLSRCQGQLVIGRQQPDINPRMP
jgi:hypothetical protein